jgi:anti-sigma factor RsiW
MRLRRRREPQPMSCAEVAEALQSYLDTEIDDLVARRVAQHLEMCRRCGLEADTYRAIKDAVARRAMPVDPYAMDRLRAFGARLAAEHRDTGSPPA